MEFRQKKGPFGYFPNVFFFSSLIESTLFHTGPVVSSKKGGDRRSPNRRRREGAGNEPDGQKERCETREIEGAGKRRRYSPVRWGWWLHLRFSTRTLNPWRLLKCKKKNEEEEEHKKKLLLCLFIVQHLGGSSSPGTFFTLLFPEAWKHYISQPLTPTGTKARRWKFKGYVLLDSRRQINLNMYFGHGFVCRLRPRGPEMIIWHK